MTESATSKAAGGPGQRPEGTLLLIGDPMISSASMVNGILGQVPARYRPITSDWGLDVDQVVDVNRTVERGGPASVEVDPVEIADPETVVGVVTHFFPLSAAQLRRWPALRFVATLRAGTENIDTAELQRRGVDLITNTGRNANAVAEFTVAAMLGLLRNLGENHHAIRTERWRPPAPAFGLQELSGKTVGLVGFGAIGSLVAQRLRGFETRTLVHDPWLAAADVPDHVELCGLPELLGASDIVSLHLRSTPETHHVLGDAQLELLKPNALLINTARAELVDEAAMIERLSDGRLAGAALDVFSAEPLPSDHVLRGLPNVLLSPHVAGVSVQARTNAPHLMGRRLRSYLGDD